MAAPTQQRIWTITANQRIPIASYATLVLQGGRYLRLLAITLLANGYTCKGSSNGAAGAMDAVNRWATDADASVQAANTTTAVSWMVLTDGNGCDILLSFVGATGDIQRISFSPSGVYAAAGTPTHTPTAADEQIIWSGTSLITNSTAADRVLHVWIDSEAKLMRTCVYVAGALGNGTWGVELVNANRMLTAFSPAVWGFHFNLNGLNLTTSGVGGTYSAGTSGSARGGEARLNAVSCNLFCGIESYGNTYDTFNTSKPELQAGIGQAMCPILIGTSTANRRGPIGSLYDWWTAGATTTGTNSGPANVVFPSGGWMQLCPGSGAAWPWDDVTLPECA